MSNKNRNRRRRGLKRKHKNLIHLVVIALIATSLYLERGSMTDWLFVGFSILTEFA